MYVILLILRCATVAMFYITILKMEGKRTAEAGIMASVFIDGEMFQLEQHMVLAHSV